MKKCTSKITQLTATYSFAIPYFVMLLIFYTITRNEFFILITGGDNKNYVAIAKAYTPKSKIISYIILIVATFFAAYGIEGKLVGLAWDKII